MTEEEQKQLTGFKKVFINPQIEESGEEWAFNEGCLSIPDVREDVYRQEEIHIRYWDENFKEHQEVYTGLAPALFSTNTIILRVFCLPISFRP